MSDQLPSAEPPADPNATQCVEGALPRSIVPDTRRLGSDDPIPDPPPSDQPLELIRELGRGGMGAVYLGFDPQLKRDVAYKVLLDKHLDNPDFVRRFADEAQITGQLQHPGIVPVYDLGQFGSRPFFSMKLVQGRTLADLLSARRQPEDDLLKLLKVFEHVCQTLGYAHSRAVVHRDLKPSNIMVGEHGEVLVLDWGLARKVSDDAPSSDPLAAQAATTAASATRTDVVIGTPAYMPPEQARGDRALDVRTDVFGLGAILCEILTGQPPYSMWDANGAYGQALQGDLTDAHARLNGCSADADLRELARACLAPKLDERPTDARAVADRMAAHFVGVQNRLRVAELERAAAQARAAEERKARRLTVALGVAVLAIFALLSGGTGWFLLQRAEDRAERERLARERTQLLAQTLREVEELQDLARQSPADPARWAEAIAAARLAEGLADSAPTHPETARRIATLLAESTAAERTARTANRDRRMQANLEAIRLAQAEVKDDRFDRAAGDPLYATAFREYGIDLDRLPPEESATAVRHSAIRAELCGALDEWAEARAAARGRRDDPGVVRILFVARSADPDPWRARFRDALESNDRTALKTLAETADLPGLTSGTAALLGKALQSSGNFSGAIAFLVKAQRQFPGDFWINHQLAYYLADARPARNEEAIRFYTAAVAIRQSPGARLNLGNALWSCNRPDDAAAEFQEAIRLQPTYASAYANLGLVRSEQRRSPEALAAIRKAVELDPTRADLHGYLGQILFDSGRLDEALRAFDDALKLDPNRIQTLVARGLALAQREDYDAAASSYETAIHLRPGMASAHYYLGNVRSDQERWPEAIAAYLATLKLNPEYAEASCNLGHALRESGRFAEALVAMRKGHELGSARPNWKYNSAGWVKHLERLREREAQLPDVVRGAQTPAGPREHLEFAWMVQLGWQRPALALALYEPAFAANDPATTAALGGARYNAACAAVLAAAGRGNDVGPIHPDRKAAWRTQALEWLRADLTDLQRRVAAAQLSAAQHGRSLRHWLSDADLASVRDDSSRLPEAERAAWQAFWAEVAARLPTTKSQ